MFLYIKITVKIRKVIKYMSSSTGNISPYVASYIRERSHPATLENQVSTRLKNIEAINKCVNVTNMQQNLTVFVNTASTPL